MTQFLLVALGGAFGSALRYGAGLFAARAFGLNYPWATLGVNVLGGFAMGLLAARVGPEQESMRLALGVGALGGFTTFSAFSLEALRLLQSNAVAGLGYVGVSVVLSIAACGVGLVIGRL